VKVSIYMYVLMRCCETHTLPPRAHIFGALASEGTCVCVSMEATAVALWVERIAFLLLSCFTSIESCGFGWGAVLGLLALSNFLFRCAMEEKASAVKLKKLHKNLKNSDSRVS